jgi:hypothetical protein
MLEFSLLGRCHGECGSHKKAVVVARPEAISTCRAVLALVPGSVRRKLGGRTVYAATTVPRTVAELCLASIRWPSL